MSETETTATIATALPPGMTIDTKTFQVNGKQEEMTVVTYGSPPRSVSVVDLDMGVQFDLAEVTGGSDNIEFRSLAFIAASVREIDGHPVGSFGAGMISKSSLRATLKRLGRDGLRAATAGVNSLSPNGEPESEFKAAAGNS